ncbi:HTH_Tnp_Tc3_2 domain-containing protein [Trichonephila clavipes]|nr:HTH_Tnp_Tc3_2 domain-containing protein [Trichonephila clavipes]
MDICKCIVPLRHGDTLNRRRAASPVVWLVEGDQGFLPLNWGGTEQKRTVTCMVLKAKANDREMQVGRIDVSAATSVGNMVVARVGNSGSDLPSRRETTDLRNRRPLRRLPLTPHHRQCRLDFCRPRATWSVTDWRRVIFSDESRFSLSADDHRTRVWRRTGQRSDPAFIVERHTAISQGVKSKHTIIFDGPSRHFDSSQIRGRYFNADCATHAIKLPFINRIMLVQYCATLPQCLQGYDVLPWPANLSPIEHVWNALGRLSRDTGELTAQMKDYGRMFHNK